MVRLTALALVVTALFSGASVAQTIMGSGATSCSEYLAIKKFSDNVGKAMELWVVGYISGLNAALYATTRGDVLKGQEAASVIGFVSGYCSVNGANDLYTASNAYWSQRLTAAR